MFSFNNSDIATLAALGVVNFFCAGSVHRAVLLNSGFVQRRLLFEGLSLFGFVVAIALTLLSVLMWVSNPPFVIACTILWFLLCLLVVVRIWRGHRKRLNKKILELPELCFQQTIYSNPPAIMPGKNRERLKVAPAPLTERADSLSDGALHIATVDIEKDTAAQPDQPVEFGTDSREKLKKYNKKREYKSAAISNLSAYRLRSKKILAESSTKTASK